MWTAIRSTQTAEQARATAGELVGAQHGEQVELLTAAGSPVRSVLASPGIARTALASHSRSNRGSPTVRRPGKAGLDPAMAGRLWDATAELVGTVAR
ncbi:hypothetical protein [Streptomyces sp. Inha503]|uniref:hypothetical protein n=1 Tax=Streptomyces sp. Inha503 TaxID=3383314 RepID=UPI0039A314C3